MGYYSKYLLYKYLNSHHGQVSQKLFVFFSYLICKCLGVPNSIFAQLKSDISSSDFKLVVRRLSWLLNASGHRFLSFSDPYFDFSLGLDSDTCKDLYAYASERYFLEDEVIRLITLAQLSSSVVEGQVSVGQSISVSELQEHTYDIRYQEHIKKVSTLVKRAKVKRELVVSKPNLNRNTQLRVDPLKKNLMTRHAREILRDLMQLFISNSYPVFVISGTFLGLHREGGFLDHDYDVDLGVFEADYDDGLLRLLNDLDEFKDLTIDYPCFRSQSGADVVYARPRVPALIKLIHSTGVQIDLFVHFKCDDNKVWHGSSIHRWNNTDFDLVTREFFDFAVLAPGNADLYLAENYGNWRVPRTKFSCSTDTPNIGFSNSCKNKCYFLKLEYLQGL